MISDQKGQITIEAVLILGLFILIFVGVTIPMAFKAKNSAIDTTIVADAKYATEQIASAANTIVVNGSRRTIDVYVPGYKSESIHIGTRICSDGNYLNTTVLIVRSGVQESHNISAKLYGSGWSLSTPDAQAPDRILEDVGRRYTLTITYKSISSSTDNTMTNVTKAATACALSFSGSPPPGW